MTCSIIDDGRNVDTNYGSYHNNDIYVLIPVSACSLPGNTSCKSAKHKTVQKMNLENFKKYLQVSMSQKEVSRNYLYKS